MKPKLLEAAEDLRYLLSRGYRRESSVNFVGNRYQLTKAEKLTLFRAVYDRKSAEEHRRKLVRLEAVRSRRLSIDGYNVLITVEAALTGRPLISCDDGFIRDTSAVHAGYSMTDVTSRALDLLVAYLNEAEPSEVNFYLDAQISRSGELASEIRRRLEAAGLKGGAYAVKQADTSVLAEAEIIVTSDSTLISKAKAVWDLAGEIARRTRREWIVNLSDVSGTVT